MSTATPAHIPTPWQGAPKPGTHTVGTRDGHGVRFGANVVTDANGVEHDIEEREPNVWHCKTHNTRA